LVMRQKPKHLLFPAFRFLLQRHRSNQRKIRLRHLLLLALRLLLVAGMCLALARPQLSSEHFHLSAEQPVAAVLVFDTSPSMDYAVGGLSLPDESLRRYVRAYPALEALFQSRRTRLVEAQRRALELLEELPRDSRVAILDSGEAGGEWLVTLDQARERLAN